MATKRDIKYLNLDFESFRSQLINYSQTYFPDTYTDFDPSSPGIMFMEMASYIGDVMSFYLNNQIQENFLQYARQTNNLYDLAYMFGYKPKSTGLANVEIEFFQLLPAKNVNGDVVPDFDYALYIDSNTSINSNNGGTSFIIEDPIDFTVSSSLDPTTITISQIINDQPSEFLISKKRKAISGNISLSSFSFGNPQEFPTVTINANNIAGIIDAIDSDGNEWYEVDYLGQELIFDSIKNTNINNPNISSDIDAPFILKTKKVQRRFTTRLLNPSTLQIQFGSGNPNNIDDNIIPDPSNVGIGLPFEKNKLTTAYSPTNFIFTNTYGIAPSNTTITIRYLTGGGIVSNVPSNSLTNINTVNTRFLKSNLNPTTAQYIFDSLACNNELAASGGKDGDSIEEIRQNTISNFSSQLRNVTENDYLVRALSMPSKYGIVSKAYTQKPKTDDKLSSLDLYVLSYNSNNNLALASNTLKNNLKTYLNQYRMIGDNINIKDAFIINIGVDFEIITLPDYNNNDVLLECINELISFFDIKKWQINQPILLRDINILLDNVEGVQTVKNIKITNNAGTLSGYSKYSYDIASATLNNVIYPSLDPSIFEVKFPLNDIRGKCVNF
jgi:hypothetical protein